MTVRTNDLVRVTCEFVPGVGIEIEAPTGSILEVLAVNEHDCLLTAPGVSGSTAWWYGFDDVEKVSRTAWEAAQAIQTELLNCCGADVPIKLIDANAVLDVSGGWQAVINAVTGSPV